MESNRSKEMHMSLAAAHLLNNKSFGASRLRPRSAGGCSVCSSVTTASAQQASMQVVVDSQKAGAASRQGPLRNSVCRWRFMREQGAPQNLQYSNGYRSSVSCMEDPNGALGTARPMLSSQPSAIEVKLVEALRLLPSDSAYAELAAHRDALEEYIACVDSSSRSLLRRIFEVYDRAALHQCRADYDAVLSRLQTSERSRVEAEERVRELQFVIERQKLLICNLERTLSGRNELLMQLSASYKINLSGLHWLRGDESLQPSPNIAPRDTNNHPIGIVRKTASRLAEGVGTETRPHKTLTEIRTIQKRMAAECGMAQDDTNNPLPQKKDDDDDEEASAARQLDAAKGDLSQLCGKPANPARSQAPPPPQQPPQIAQHEDREPPALTMTELYSKCQRPEVCGVELEGGADVPLAGAPSAASSPQAAVPAS